MKRIVVTDRIKNLAAAYAKRVEKELKLVDALNTLRGMLQGNRSNYVQAIIDHLPEILVMLPWDFKEFHDDNFAKYDAGGDEDVQLSGQCTITGADGEDVTKQFFQHVVDALQYAVVQQEVFPEYVNKLGVRSCIYCNAQYAVSAKKGKTGRSTPYRTNYTLDHWKPKSKYPYLSVAFYNLYPCCAPCNQAKSWYERDWMMYCKQGEEGNPFQFKVEDMSLLDYLRTWDAEKLQITFQAKTAGEFPDYDKNFHISKLYSNFKSEVEEVIWRSKIYSPKMIEAMQQSGVYQIKPEDVNRYIIGNFDREDDILKRPLAKLIQDVAKQIGLIPV